MRHEFALQSTEKEVLKILELKLRGFFYNTIASVVKKDRLTVVWWCNLYKATAIVFLKNETKRTVILQRKKDYTIKVPMVIVLKIKKEELDLKADVDYKDVMDLNNGNKEDKEEIKKFIKSSKTIEIKGDGFKTCLRCGKIKTNKQWIKTRYCSLECWDKFNFVPPRNYNY